jgi:murein DD-endopeptidase MepM/ murein hydrolase activator NlpD
VIKLLRWGNPGSRENQSLRDRTASRRRRALPKERGTAALCAVTVLATAGAVYCGVGYFRYERLATAELTAARNAESANIDLQEAVVQLRDQFAAASQSLNMAQRQIAELNDEARQQTVASEQVATSKTDRIGQLTRALEQAQRDLRLAEVQRVTMIARLSKSEAEAEGHARQQQQIQAGQDQWQKRLQQVTAERDRAASERDHFRARVGELEQRLSMLQTRQPQRPVAETQPQATAPSASAVAPTAPAATAAAAPAAAGPTAIIAAVPAATAPAAAAVPAAPAQAAPHQVVAVVQPAPVAPAPHQVVAVVQPAPAAPAPPVVAAAPAVTPAVATMAPVAPAVATGGLAQFERVLASAGVDVKHLFSQYGINRGEGGPFIPAPRGTQPPPLSADKLAALSRLVKSLPVSAPLESYEIGSRFGVRGDPINGRASLHTGTDFRAPYMSPVYATAAGIVTYAGYRADYGKIVEIDHGNGLASRYGHLHRQTVSVGQQVAANTQIGLLGSTGRATGPHVHYEVLVNGEPQDPEKFIGLSRIVPVVAHR